MAAPARLAGLPQLPTLAELGYPQLNALGQTWFGLVAPAGTPPAVVQKLNAGIAQVLVVPDLESGNMLAKQLSFVSHAEGAGLVLGARVPIVLTSRADPLSARIASAALAKLVAVRKAEGKA